MFGNGAWNDLGERFHLTQREREVAERVFLDCGYGEIARELGISPHTAEEYFRRVKTKLGVRSRGKFYLCVFQEILSKQSA
jgi:DNA-binding CsgD family transcriptional regulator